MMNVVCGGSYTSSFGDVKKKTSLAISADLFWWCTPPFGVLPSERGLFDNLRDSGGKTPENFWVRQLGAGKF